MNEVLDPLSTFPYAADAEPDDSWTIEQLTQLILIRARNKNTKKCRDLVDSLTQQYEDLRKCVWDLHYDASAVVGDERKTDSVPSSAQIEAAATQSSYSSSLEAVVESKNATQLFIEVVQGPYHGATFILKPEIRKPCFIGRSAGKKFRTNGISLANNPEVSTTHGKVEIKIEGLGDVKFYYTDTGSTNGTLYNDAELEDNVPLELLHGTELTIGGSVLRFSFLYD